MKTVNFLVKWPAYLGSLNKYYLKKPQNNKRPLYQGCGGMYGLIASLLNKYYSSEFLSFLLLTGIFLFVTAKATMVLVIFLRVFSN